MKTVGKLKYKQEWDAHVQMMCNLSFFYSEHSTLQNAYIALYEHNKHVHILPLLWIAACMRLNRHIPLRFFY
jgi:hypothetical protein